MVAKTYVHFPACDDWQAHLARLCAETVGDPGSFDLATFADEVIRTWADENDALYEHETEHVGERWTGDCPDCRRDLVEERLA